jgi:Cu(I)/Ag(I) efflux system membrane protein CusA/SilA
MTVSTVVAGLLPIMWSSRTGAEVMKPLAAPVLGGMVSSLAHVLVVTPVIFYWLRARSLPAERKDSKRIPVVAATALIGLAIVAAAWPAVRPMFTIPEDQVLQTVASGDVRATFRSESGVLTRGRNRFSIAFTDARGRPLDAGVVHLSATMPMPGMVMSGGVEVERTEQTGRYLASGEFGMSGVWHMTLQWDGPVGRGSTSFQRRVQ